MARFNNSLRGWGTADPQIELKKLNSWRSSQFCHAKVSNIFGGVVCVRLCYCFPSLRRLTACYAPSTKGRHNHLTASILGAQQTLDQCQLYWWCSHRSFESNAKWKQGIKSDIGLQKLGARIDNSRIQSQIPKMKKDMCITTFSFSQKLTEHFFSISSDFNRFWYEYYADLITASFIADDYNAFFPIQMCTKYLLTCCNDLNQ